MQTLQQEPLLHLTQKQRGMIGEERAQETMRAQLQGRGQQQLPCVRVAPAPMSYVTSTSHANARVDSEEWSTKAIRSICGSTRKTGNHVCRPDVCHKGSIAFCFVVSKQSYRVSTPDYIA